jgi:orotate phosphoribosyltransferase
MDSFQEKIARVARIKKALETRAFVRAKDMPFVSRGSGRLKEKAGWLFDVRAILLSPEVLTDIAEEFLDDHQDIKEFQIGGIETAGIPLITASVLLRHKKQGNVSGFFIRKSRKKDGLMKMIEGEVRSGVPIVLIDDILNSGKSMIRQVEVLEALGYTITAIWSLIRFRDIDAYHYFTNKNIRIKSLFTLDDFTDSLNIRNLEMKESAVTVHPFTVLWRFRAAHPSLFHVVPKSQPAIDSDTVYFGTDKGIFYALNQKDGTVKWSFQTEKHSKGKGIFSSPALSGGVVYFGAYDGNIYALSAVDGKKKWVSYEADWVGSSPAIAEDLGMIFIGTEFGLFRKRGGILALNAKTGEKLWSYSMPCYTHSSPLYNARTKEVLIGSNDGAAYLFDAQTGTLIWQSPTAVLEQSARDSGFSEHDIKASFVYDKENDNYLFGTMSGSLFAVSRENGSITRTFKTDFGIYSTPLLYGNKIYVSSLDKHLYCVDAETFEEKWRWDAGARIFASPVCIDDRIFIGANTGRLTELDPETGKEIAFFTVSERITNAPVKNAETGVYFLPTFANEIYALERK